MLISEFLRRPDLRQIEQDAIADPTDFHERAYQACKILLGRDPDPVVFSSFKRFNKGGDIGDPELNRKGLHLFRYAFGTYAALHRTKNPRFLEQGHLRIEQFLDTDHHRDLQKILNHYPVSGNKQGFNNCQIEAKRYSPIDHAVNHSGMRDLVMAVVGRDDTEVTALYNRNTFIQRVDNLPNDGDEQKDIHSDIFYPAVKWWYFPDQVEIGDGPLRFQTTAPRRDASFYEWLHRQSCAITQGSWDRARLRGHPEGSLRVNDSELAEMQITVEPITVPANTLIIANVQLFHGRGESHYPHIRNSIHGSIRISRPFLIAAER